jgi:predicted transcriptional regulator
MENINIPYSVIYDTESFDKIYEKMVFITMLADNELSVLEMANICLCAETSVRNAVKSLESKGIIEVERNRTGTGGIPLPNKYHIIGGN